MHTRFSEDVDLTNDFHTRGTVCACAIIIVQEVEVHGWLLSGITMQ